MILIITYISKKKSRRRPEYKISLNLIGIIILSLIFLSGIILEFIY
jgi:hypothetical protein